MKDGELWYQYKRVADDSKIWGGSMHSTDAVCMHAIALNIFRGTDLVVMVRHLLSQ